MDTQQARHAMVDGKRCAYPDADGGRRIHRFQDERFQRLKGWSVWETLTILGDRDDWYVLEEDREKPGFRECAVTAEWRHADEYKTLGFTGAAGGWRPLLEVLRIPDFAGILMADGEAVIGLFEYTVGGKTCYIDEVELKDLKSGYAKPVDLTKCKVLLRESQ